MSMGDYDETEHERRERKTGDIEADFSEGRAGYEGKLVFESGGSAEELLAKFNEIKSR